MLRNPHPLNQLMGIVPHQILDAQPKEEANDILNIGAGESAEGSKLDFTKKEAPLDSGARRTELGESKNVEKKGNLRALSWQYQFISDSIKVLRIRHFKL